MAKLKKKKRSVDPSEDFIRKLKQLSSGLMHMAATLDFQYRSSGSLFQPEEYEIQQSLLEQLAEVGEGVREGILKLHNTETHPINQDAADRIRDMDIPT